MRVRDYWKKKKSLITCWNPDFCLTTHSLFLQCEFNAAVKCLRGSSGEWWSLSLRQREETKQTFLHVSLQMCFSSSHAAYLGAMTGRRASSKSGAKRNPRAIPDTQWRAPAGNTATPDTAEPAVQPGGYARVKAQTDLSAWLASLPSQE